MQTTFTITHQSTIPLPSQIYGVMFAVPYSTRVLIGGEPTLTAPTDKNVISVFDTGTMVHTIMDSLDVAGANPNNTYKKASDASSDGFILAAMEVSYPYLVSTSRIVATTNAHQTDFFVADIAHRKTTNYFFFGKAPTTPGGSVSSGFAIHRFDKSTQTTETYSSFSGRATSYVNASEFDDLGYIIGHNSSS